jgi:hypothetical protein
MPLDCTTAERSQRIMLSHDAVTMSRAVGAEGGGRHIAFVSLQDPDFLAGGATRFIPLSAYMTGAVI